MVSPVCVQCVSRIPLCGEALGPSSSIFLFPASDVPRMFRRENAHSCVFLCFSVGAMSSRCPHMVNQNSQHAGCAAPVLSLRGKFIRLKPFELLNSWY